MSASTQESVAELQTGASERVSRLRERIVHAPREACIERARYLTESMSAHWEEHPLTRISKALAHILENVSAIIREDELIVGCRTSKLKGAPLFPENKSRWIEGDVDSFEERVIQKVLHRPGRGAGAQRRDPALLARPHRRGEIRGAAAGRRRRGHGQVRLHHDPRDHLRHRPLHHEPRAHPGARPLRGHRRSAPEAGRDERRRAGRRDRPPLRRDDPVAHRRHPLRPAPCRPWPRRWPRARAIPEGRRSSKRSPESAGECPSTRRAPSTRPSSASTSST